MRFSHNKLWKLLIDLKLNRENLRERARLSASTLSKLSRSENVNTGTLSRICEALNYDIADICEVVPTNQALPHEAANKEASNVETY